MTPLFIEVVPLVEAPLELLRELTIRPRTASTPSGRRVLLNSGMAGLLKRADRIIAHAVLGTTHNRLVGWAGVEIAPKDWPDTEVFVSVFVAPRHRRQGYGTELVRAALEFVHAKYPGWSPVCMPSDEAGLHTFLKAGHSFHPSRELPVSA